MATSTKPATPATATGTDPRALRIDAGWVVTVDAQDQVLAEHSVLVRDGRIEAIVPTAAQPAESHTTATVLDRREHVLMPGLINAHTHLPMNLMRGLADDLPLARWLGEHIWPAEAKHQSESFVRDGTGLALAECLLGGVTCVNDMYFHAEISAEVIDKAGMRATLGMIVLDFPTPFAANREAYLARGLALHDTLRGHARLSTAIAPHAPYTVNTGTLERIATLSAELDLPVHMHVHETAGEVTDFFTAHGVRPLQRLHEIGLLNPQLLAVHLTQLDRSEVQLLADTGVHAVHCPESNLKLASGVCPVPTLLEAGVGVLVGTDSAASNNDLNLLGELRTAALLAKGLSGDATALPAYRALRMITIDAARALGLGDEIGSIEIGKAADLVTIEPNLAWQPVYDPVSHLVYCTDRSQVRDVWVAGRPLLSDRRLQSLDSEQLTHHADKWKQALGTLSLRP